MKKNNVEVEDLNFDQLTLEFVNFATQYFHTEIQYSFCIYDKLTSSTGKKWTNKPQTDKMAN